MNFLRSLCVFILLFPIPLFCKQTKPPLIVISCTPKSGSTTLEHSFKRMKLEVLRMHRITDQEHKRLKVPFDRPVIFIDSMRDVLSRKISSFFALLTNYMHLSQKQIIKKYEAEGLGFLYRKFNKIILHRKGMNTFDDWKRWYGYDCLKDAAFNHKKKYQLKRKGNLYFLNLRFDDIDKWESIIRSLRLPINLSRFKIVPANQAKKKWYKDIYADFLAHFTITEKNFNKILQDHEDRLNHFYTQKEIEQLIEKWKPHIRPN